MKKAFTAAAVLLISCLCIGAALASGGSAGDPLVSLSYLNDIFLPNTDLSIDSRLNTADESLKTDVEERLDTMTSAVLAATGQTIAATAEEVTLNQGDALSGASGLFATPLAGKIILSITAGTVINVSTGEEVPSGTILTNNHRYMVAEDSSAVFTASVL